MHLITEYSCSCVFNSVVTKLMVLKHFAILSITVNQVFFFPSMVPDWLDANGRYGHWWISRPRPEWRASK